MLRDNLNSKNNSNYVWSCIKNIIDILTLLILAASLFLTSKTLSEMRADRNESFKAVIAANPVNETMVTSSRAYLDDSVIVPFTIGYAKPLEVPNNNDLLYKTLSSSSLKSNQNYTQLSFSNIGSGTATKVKFSWDDKNIDTLYQNLLDVDEKANKYIYISNNGHHLRYMPTHHHFNETDMKVDTTLYIPLDSIEYSYMTSNCQENYTISFPIVYSLLCSEILIHDSEKEPCVKLNVEFSDTQGITYNELITVKASHPSSKRLLSEENDGSTKEFFGLTYTISMDHNMPIRK